MRPIVLGIVLSFFPLLSQAQIDVSGLSNNATTIVLEPAFPSPETTFTATLSDYGGEGYGAMIKWYYNGTELEWATNRRSVELTAPRAGEKAVVKATLEAPNATVKEVSSTLNPLYLDIIIEPQTHVPSFYRGRALPSPGATINATALLSNGTQLAGPYLYTWRLNNTVIQGGPLRDGKRVSFTMPQDSFPSLSVTVTELNGTILARRTIAIPNAAPRVLFYEVNTLYGLRPLALSNTFTFFENTITMRAVPFNLDSEVYNNPTIATWEIAGESLPSGSNPYEITLEKTGSNTEATLDFRVQSTTKLLQGTRSSLTLDII